MEHYNFWSLVPPILAIILAIKTRQVFVSLLFGIWLGWVIISGGNLLSGFINTINALVKVFEDAGNTRTILFSCLVGALIAFVQKSGGVEGFIININKFLDRLNKSKLRNNRILVQFLAWLTGVIIFVETNISVLSVGSIFRPLFDKLKIPREKLAYIADSSSAPISILIPFNAWGAYIMGLLVLQNIDQPFGFMLKTIPLNFYPILAVLVVPAIILTRKDFGPMKRAEKRALEEGKVLRDGATPMISDEVISLTKKKDTKARAINMIIPIGIMVLMMPVILIYSGWSQVPEIDQLSFGKQLFSALGRGSGSTAVLFSVIIAIITGGILYKIQNIFKLKELTDLTLKGISGLMPLAFLMLLAFAIGNVCNELGTGKYVAEISKEWLSPHYVPVIIFITSCVIAFSTGTSWGTFAIMIAVAVPMSQSLNADLSLTVAAALGGGVFGDHCSPISDTTIISSMASASDHIDHVKTQLPYAITAGLIASLLYLLIGYFAS